MSATGAERLSQAFAAARAEKRAALVCYVMAGDPSLEATGALLAAVDAAGADVIELGIPFSDPIADGPVLQEAAMRALKMKTTLAQVIALAAQHKSLRAPMVAMGYLNPILNLGYARFAREAAAAGLCGAIIPDLPLEEAGELRAQMEQEGLALVPLAAPTTEGARLRAITASAQGFVYTVSVNGVTGARAELPPELGPRLAELRSLSKVPVAVGFGVSRAEQVRALAPLTDGIVVGSALVRAHHERGIDAAASLVRELRAALGQA
ncbi:MAG: tryptophan synthase subunit alpha [Deltaproteobacteria bacterium]|nr:tryptophan synthase subunit alpha [Deltaproteobacteria bacterium]